MESVPLLWRTVTASPVGIEPMTILEGGPPYNWYLIHNVEKSTFSTGWHPNTPYDCAEARRTQVADATFRDHFLNSLAAFWMFCFRCSFSCCQTFPGKTVSSCWEPMWWAQSSLGNSWTVSIVVSNGKLSENKVTKYKQVAQQLAETFSNGLPSAWPEQP